MNKMGFGFLRLPQVEVEGKKAIDYDVLNPMVDAFLAKGGNYFDTAYTYLNGDSEIALRESLVKRHPRNSFRIADKLPSWKVKAPEELESYFKEQQERCGVDFFDVYLLHWLNRDNYAVAEKFDEFAFLRRLKEQGRVGKIGLSYHDSAELLDEILTAHPEVDIVQLQINYLDWESASVQSCLCYDCAVKHGKEVVIMEPVKGGTLVNLPAEAAALLAQQNNDSPARWALRFAQSLPAVSIVLSGMNTMEQMEENMEEILPMTAEEAALCQQTAALIRSNTAIACTACEYCVSNCPKGIAIPHYFKLYNEYARNNADDWKIQPVYQELCLTYGKANDCIRCHLCERNCPQQLPITDCLEKVAKAFE